VTFYRYRAEFDVHEFDCSGPVDLETGLQRLAQLQRELSARPAQDGVSRLLVDFRNTVWASPDVHMQLARATRTWLDAAVHSGTICVAFLHQQQRDVQAGGPSPNEAWFADEADALHWLTRVER
jgi:hypothetical protein